MISNNLCHKLLNFHAISIFRLKMKREYKLSLSIFDNKVSIHSKNNYKNRFNKNLLMIRNIIFELIFYH